jgi:hypothetical protein
VAGFVWKVASLTVMVEGQAMVCCASCSGLMAFGSTSTSARLRYLHDWEIETASDVLAVDVLAENFQMHD